MSRIVQEIYTDCDLHTALMNTGWRMRREKYYEKAKYTGLVKDYYEPIPDPDQWSSMRATERDLQEMYGNSAVREYAASNPYSYMTNDYRIYR